MLLQLVQCDLYAIGDALSRMGFNADAIKKVFGVLQSDQCRTDRETLYEMLREKLLAALRSNDRERVSVLSVLPGSTQRN